MTSGFEFCDTILVISVYSCIISTLLSYDVFLVLLQLYSHNIILTVLVI